MHPVQERDPAPGEPAGGGDVRRDHALLDELVGDEPGRGLEVRDAAVIGEDDTGLPDLEVDGAPPLPRPPQHRVDLPERLEMGQEPAEPTARAGVPGEYRRLHLQVGEARPRAHDRVAEEGPRDPPPPVDVHLAGETQPVDLRVERADPVGEPPRQHRHHPPREVDGRAAHGRLPVEGGPRRHVVGHVGDGHGEFPTARTRRAVDRVVEVLRVRPVDRHQGKAAEVRPVAGGVRDLERNPFRFGQRVLRPDVGDPVGSDRDLRRHAGPFGVAQALDDTAGRRSVAPPLSGGRIGELDHHHLPVGALPVRDRHVVGNVPVVGGYEGKPPGPEEAADHDTVVALDHLDHDPRPPEGRRPPRREVRTSQATRSPCMRPHLARGQEEVLAAVVAGEESVSVAMGDYPAPAPLQGRARTPFRLGARRPAADRAGRRKERRHAVSRRNRGRGFNCFLSFEGRCRTLPPLRGPRWRNW